MAMKTCKIDGCARGGRMTRGMCKTHYARWKRYGDPHAVKRRPNGQTSADDAREALRTARPGGPDGACMDWPGAVNSTGYGATRRGLVHRAVWGNVPRDRVVPA